MSGTTSIPQPSFGPTGFSVPAESAILAGATADINAAFGGNLNPDLDTPQGQLATTQTAIVADKDNQFLYLASQFDPAFAEGRFQDAIGRIYFLTRNAAEPTTVQANCVGAVNTSIPQAAIVVAADGNLYQATSAGTIGITGTLSLPFACQVVGPIACPVNNLGTIYQAIPGWDSVNNPTEGVLGQDVENRASFEARRAASVAINATGFLDSVRASVLALPGVLDCFAIENTAGTSAVINSVTLVPHSIMVAVVGGSDTLVAETIWTKKSPGCGYNGNTTITVTDSSYTVPQPSYSVLFERPTATAILFAVSVANTALVPSDALTQIQNAIIGAAAGADGGPPMSTGETVYASRYYAPIAALGPWAQIVSVLVGVSTASAYSVALPITQTPTVSASDVSINLV
jgi:uncharacterized phage protein gp47/JayE